VWIRLTHGALVRIRRTDAATEYTALRTLPIRRTDAVTEHVALRTSPPHGATVRIRRTDAATEHAALRTPTTLRRTDAATPPTVLWTMERTDMISMTASLERHLTERNNEGAGRSYTGRTPRRLSSAYLECRADTARPHPGRAVSAGWIAVTMNRATMPLIHQRILTPLNES